MSKENKIVLNDGTTIKITGGEEKKNLGVSIYEGDYRDKNNHASTHIDLNTETGEGVIKEHDYNHSNYSEKPIQCYLTTACLMHYNKEFNDNCEELTILRWFRDNFVSKEDIEMYYEIAPIIVNNIDNYDKSYLIYEFIYHNVVSACVNAIKIGNYRFAYSRYKNSILALKKQFINSKADNEKGKKLILKCN